MTYSAPFNYNGGVIEYTVHVPFNPCYTGSHIYNEGKITIPISIQK